MGCGKSTVLRWLAGRGVAVFDSDACVRRLYEEDASLQEALRERFGAGIFTPGGKVDRGAIGSIVFQDPSKLVALEALLHPRVRASWQEETRKAHACLVVEIPLLFEKELEDCFDLTCSVISNPHTQHRRLTGRGWSPSEIKGRLARQWPLAEKARRADVVILNDGDLDHLERQLLLTTGELGISLTTLR